MDNFVIDFLNVLLPRSFDKVLFEKKLCGCKFCSKEQISGYGYKCLECFGYFLCSECFERRKFSELHQISHKVIRFSQSFKSFCGILNLKPEEMCLEILKEKFSNEIHLSIQCNICLLKPIKGLRFKCDVCIGFNACKNCSERSFENHKKNHPMVVYLKNSSNEIKFGEFKLEHEFEMLGSGTFFKATYENQDVICKRIKARKEKKIGYELGTYEYDLLNRSFLREIVGCDEIKGENILRMIAYCKVEKEFGHDFFMLTELFKTDLESFIKNEPNLIYKERFEISAGIASGLARIHKMGYIHYGITASNIFLTKDNIVKIGDMNRTRLEVDEVKFIVGISAKSFMPPEFNTRTYTNKLDVFSFGLIINELFGGKHTFSNKKVQITSEGELIFDDFISKSICNDPNDRLLMSDIDDKFSFMKAKINEDLKNNHNYYDNQESIMSKNRLFKSKYYRYFKMYNEEKEKSEKELTNQNRIRIKTFYEKKLHREEAFNSTYPDSQVPFMLNCLRHSEYLEDNTQKCLEYCQKYLDKSQEIFKGEKNPETARALAAFGFSYLYLVKDSKKALYFYEKAVEINQFLFGEMCPVVAQNYFRIADCHYEMKNFLEALKYNLKSLNIRRSIYERNTEFIVNSLNKTSLCYLQLDDTENYLKYRREEIQIKGELYQVKHPNKIYSDIMLIRGKDNGREAWHYVVISNEKKYELLRKHKAGTNIDVSNFGEIIESGWGKDPPSVIRDRLSLIYEIDYPHFENFKINGKTINKSFYDFKNEDPVLSCLYDSLKYEYEFNNGENNLDVVKCLLQLCSYYAEDIQDSYNCVLISDKIIEICGRIFKNEINYYSANGLFFKAYCYLLFDNEESKALVCFKQVLEMREKLFGLKHPSVGLTNYYIGQCYLKLNTMNEGLNSFLKCLDIYRKVYTDHLNIFIVYVLDEIVNFYERIADDSNYTKYRSECLKIKKELFKVKHPDKMFYDYVLKIDIKGEKPIWNFILIENELKYDESKKNKNIELSAYGKIIKSGWGTNPSKSIMEQIKREYGYDID